MAVPLVGYLLLFTAVGIGFIFVHLILGKVIRPSKPDADKLTIYECGEPTIGSAWIQFDLRFYVVALLFVIFDVEVAFFFPWAVVFGKTNTIVSHEGAAVTPEVQEAKRDLLGSAGPDPISQPQAEAARQFALIALGDILIFFGVLLVGFVYLWKRGDLDWVRSTAAERAAAGPAVPSPQPSPARAESLVGAGHP